MGFLARQRSPWQTFFGFGDLIWLEDYRQGHVLTLFYQEFLSSGQCLCSSKHSGSLGLHLITPLSHLWLSGFIWLTPWIRGLPHLPFIPLRSPFLSNTETILFFSFSPNHYTHPIHISALKLNDTGHTTTPVGSK